MSLRPRRTSTAAASRGAARSRVLVVTSLAALVAVTAAPTASATLPVERTQAKSIVYKVRVPHSFYGVHDRYLSSLRSPSTGSIRLWDSGTTWATIEPTEGSWNWAPLDTAVEAAHADGTAVSLTLGMSPSWAAASPTDAPDLQKYHDYVQAVMERYSPQNWGYQGIGAYQVWNESNIKTFWSGTPSQLAAMTKTLHDVRDAVDPTALVVAPAMVTRLPFEQKAAKAFYQTKVGSTPVWKYVDVISLNLYPMQTVTTASGTRPATPEDSMALLGSMRALLAQAKVPASLPIWNTEVNYGMGSTATTTILSEAMQVAYVMRTYILNAAQGVKRVNWYAYDMGELAGGGTLGNTLLTDPSNRSAGILTPAGVAFTRVQGWLAGTLIGTTSKRPCIANRQGTYTCVVKYARGVGRIYWNPYRSAKVRLVPSATKKTTEYGVSSRARGGSTLKVNFAPVLVKSKK